MLVIKFHVGKKGVGDLYPDIMDTVLFNIMNTVMYDPTDTVFEFATNFHTPGRLDFRNFKFQPIFTNLVT